MKTLKLDTTIHPVKFLTSGVYGDAIQDMFQKLNISGIEAYIVGGFVRDFLLNRVSHDVDIEVFGCTSTQLEAVLDSYGARPLSPSFPGQQGWQRVWSLQN